MSESLTASIAAQITATLSNPLTLNTPQSVLNLSNFLAASFASGTGSGKVNQLYYATNTLASSGSVTLDLNAYGGALDSLGLAFSITKVKGFFIQILGNAQVYSCTAASVHSGGGGTGYQVGDILTIAPGSGQVNSATTLTVTTVSSGVITGVSITTAGSYSLSPTTSANAVTGGHGTSATMDLTFTTSLNTATAVYTDTDYLTIGTGASNGITWLAASAINLYSGLAAIPGTFSLVSGGAGFAVTASTACNLKIVNNGAGPVSYSIIVIGATS